MPTTSTAPLTIRPATVADVAALAPLFDAYRQFYEQPADLALARDYLHQRLSLGQSVVLFANRVKKRRFVFSIFFSALVYTFSFFIPV